MECRESLKVREFLLARLAGESAGDGAAALAAHVAGCAACSAIAADMESVWARLGDDDGADLAVRPDFEARTTAALAAETRRRTNVRSFAPRGAESPLLKVAAVLMAGVAGFFLARASGGGAFPGSPRSSPRRRRSGAARTFPSSRTGLSSRPGRRSISRASRASRTWPTRPRTRPGASPCRST